MPQQVINETRVGEETQAAISRLFLPYQKKWLADVTTPCKVLEKSRRIGFTFAEAFNAVMTAGFGLGNIYYISVGKDATQEFMDVCKEHLEIFRNIKPDIQLNPRDDTMQSIIRFPKKKIIALPSRAEAFRGKGRHGDIFILDEFAFNPNAEETLKAAMPLLTWGSRIHIISTHNGEDSVFNNFIKEVRMGQRGDTAKVYKTTLDDALEQGFYKRVCDVKGEEWSDYNEGLFRYQMIRACAGDYQEELMVIPSGNARSYIPRYLIEECVDKSLRCVQWFPPEKDFDKWTLQARQNHIAGIFDDIIEPDVLNNGDGPAYIGVDIGRNGDLTSIAICRRSQSGRLLTNFIEMSQCPFSEQEYVIWNAVNYFLAHGSYGGLWIDARGSGAPIAEKAKDSFPAVEAVSGSDPWYGTYFPKLRRVFEDKLIVIPDNKMIISDIAKVEFINGTPKIPPLARTNVGTRNQRHADSAISICQAVGAAGEFTEDEGYLVPREPIGADNSLGGYAPVFGGV